MKFQFYFLHGCVNFNGVQPTPDMFLIPFVMVPDTFIVRTNRLNLSVCYYRPFPAAQVHKSGMQHFKRELLCGMFPISKAMVNSNHTYFCFNHPSSQKRINSYLLIHQYRLSTYYWHMLFNCYYFRRGLLYFHIP